MGSDSRTWKQKFSFPDLKIWVQFYDTTLNRHSFCIHATVNIRNSTSDVLDIKLWVQIPKLKNMSSVFRTWKIWVQFSGLELWGRDLEKIKRKNQKKFQSSRKVQRHSQVSKRVLGRTFWKFFLTSVPLKVFAKKSKKIQNCRKAQNCSQNCPHVFWTCFGAIFPNFFLPSVQSRAFQIFWT